MTGRVEDKVAIVIGAARGIGAAIAERLVEEAARIVVADTLVAAGQPRARRRDRADCEGALLHRSMCCAIGSLCEVVTAVTASLD